MTEEKRQEIDFAIQTLKTILTECNLFIGIAVDKTDYNKSQIAFLDKEAYRQGKQDGLMVSLDELNKEVTK